ncbi:MULTISPECIES: hypothetical protein [Paracoccus]|uniref:hypothetical protein n=1 Tax=Paracoccus TaxID=265 RepID=UPI00112E62FC|nr:MULTISPECIES: hypothetical protein [Paracoccus]MCJ1901792.1 hypothetical protein [Paracoccus versutus]MDF3905771.1 hypothetical protein [Paracoccus sp. AS002]
MKAKNWLGMGCSLVLLGCAAAPAQQAGPHPSIWPCSTVHQELQRQEATNRQGKEAQNTVTWIPVVGIAGFAIQPDRTRETHLQTRAYECKRRAGL